MVQYAYGNSCPTGFSDPTGHWSFSLFGLQQDTAVYLDTSRRMDRVWSQAPLNVSRGYVVPGSGLRQLIEDDWLKSLIEPLTTQSDAAGAVDGIKEGKYAFHTGGDPNTLVAGGPRQRAVHRADRRL